VRIGSDDFVRMGGLRRKAFEQFHRVAWVFRQSVMKVCIHGFSGQFNRHGHRSLLWMAPSLEPKGTALTPGNICTWCTSTKQTQFRLRQTNNRPTVALRRLLIQCTMSLCKAQTRQNADVFNGIPKSPPCKLFSCLFNLFVLWQPVQAVSRPFLDPDLPVPSLPSRLSK